MPDPRKLDVIPRTHTDFIFRIEPEIRDMWLLLIALFGFVVPNGFFVYWLLVEFRGLGPVLENNLALAFILDVLVALILLSVYFARHPIGPVKWQWFVVLSFLGGLGFSLPLYYWLNRRAIGTAATHGSP